MYDMWEGDLIQETTSMLCIKILESILEVPHWTRKMFYLQCTLFIIGNQTFSNGIKWCQKQLTKPIGGENDVLFIQWPEIHIHQRFTFTYDIFYSFIKSIQTLETTLIVLFIIATRPSGCTNGTKWCDDIWRIICLTCIAFSSGNELFDWLHRPLSLRKLWSLVYETPWSSST